MRPQKIARYEVKDELGAGGMGIVYRVYDPNLYREVALKVLFKEGHFLRLSNTKQKEAVTRFLREAKVIASLQHYAIVPVYDFGWQKKEPFIVMPLMSGGGLDKRLEQGPLALDEIVPIFDWLAPALDKVHQRGIIHRDLKPSNILFDEDDKPRLCDFGIAKLTEASTIMNSTAIIGTPAYLSPEQARGDKTMDGRSDIYALGGMLFKMLTGEHPYHRAHPMALPYFHINEPPPRLDELRTDLPAGCQAIIDRAMAKKADERYSTMSEMTTALKTLLQTSRTPTLITTSHQKPPSPPATDTPHAQKHVEPSNAANDKSDYDRAIADYDQLIRLNPNDANAYCNRGDAYRKKGDYDRAIADYNQTIRLNPNYANAYNSRGYAYYNKGDYDRAIADYNQAIRLNPNDALAYNNRGVAYEKKGDYDRAIADYNQAIRLNRFGPNYANAYKNRAAAYEKKGDKG